MGNPIIPDHYHSGKIDVIEFSLENFSKEEVRGFFRINVIKYVTRYLKKNHVEDLRKAKQYLELLIELELEEWIMYGIMIFNHTGDYVSSMIINNKNEAEYVYGTLRYAFKKDFLLNFTVELVELQDGEITVESLNRDGDIVKHIVTYDTETHHLDWMWGVWDK